MLARGGHITPLAPTRCRERRVTVVREGRASAGRRVAGPAGRHPDGGDRQRPHRRRAAARRSSRTCAAAGWRSTISGPTAPIRWTIPTSPRRSRGWWRAAKPTRGIVIDGAGIGSAIAANKIDGIRAVMATDRDDRALLARAQRRERADARRDAGHAGRGAGDRDDLADDADARAALHPAAGEDSRSGAASAESACTDG